MNSRHVIAFTGPIGCGKSSAAAILIARGAVRCRFASPLKAMLRCLGLTEAHTDGDLKEVPCELLGGRTPRYAMQTLGTEWGRGLVTPDLWINAWRASLPPKGVVVVDDCRFPNEAHAVRSMGGQLIRVTRPGYTHNSGHESEAHQLETDSEVQNAGSLDELAAAVLSQVAQLAACPLSSMPSPARCALTPAGGFNPGCRCEYCSWTQRYLEHRHHEPPCFDPKCPANA